MRLNLRNKLLLFAVVIALLPLAISGQSLIRIARDELKSSANEQLLAAARQIRDEINAIYDHAWRAPLRLVRNAIDDPRLSPQQKIALLTLGIADLPDVVALQINLQGADLPMMATQQRFTERLKKKMPDPLKVLRVPAKLVEQVNARAYDYKNLLQYVPETDDWLGTIVLPLRNPLVGRKAVLTARINLRRLKQLIDTHPFAKTGEITLVDNRGRQIFDKQRRALGRVAIVKRALRLLPTRSRVITVEPHTRPNGEAMLGAVSFPRRFNWAILAEKSEKNAYAPLGVMITSLALWLSLGLAIAVIGALVFALRMSRPILAIGEAAIEVAKGNFKARVKGVRSRDEIGDLAERINEMIVQLNERFQLQKFVSADTMAAIKQSDVEGVSLGGTRRKVAMLFADIRGYTEFSEKRDPETVVEVLNHYFQHLADIILANDGDIDKYVGDQIMAVFHRGNMASNAAACALAIQDAMAKLAADYTDAELDIGIGIDTGEVVMGAMGSKERMDYTVLGDHVNLAARLCSAAGPGQTLISANVRKDIAKTKSFKLGTLAPIKVKGKAKPVRIYDLRRA